MNSTQPDTTISRDRMADYLIHLSLDSSAQDAFRSNPDTVLRASGLSVPEQELLRSDSWARLMPVFAGEDPLACIPTVVVIVVNATSCF